MWAAGQCISRDMSWILHCQLVLVVGEGGIWGRTCPHSRESSLHVRWPGMAGWIWGIWATARRAFGQGKGLELCM